MAAIDTISFFFQIQHGFHRQEREGQGCGDGAAAAARLLLRRGARPVGQRAQPHALRAHAGEEREGGVEVDYY